MPNLVVSWVLVVFTNGGGFAVPGYASKKFCQEAAQEIVSVAEGLASARVACVKQVGGGVALGGR